MNSFKKKILVLIGTLSLGIGAIGIVIPLLPSTPFFLLTLFLYTHGSERFRLWFVNTKIYDKHLRDYVDNRKMSISTKIRVLIFLTFSFAIGIYFVRILPLRILLAIIMLGHYYGIIFRIETTNTKIDDN